ncbi:hypothetical protein Leryth_018902 [Lithospermum erythrorhizon]|nr:hypothetical protein Leryth_018902 [Lithospermum erythrorhizon]
MALYIGEEEAWKCRKHPSKRHPNDTGICPTCLRDRLRVLCPHCANIRPCNCSTTATSSSSSTSSFSLFSSSARITVGRVGSLIESEPKFQRSRSLAIPFIRSRFSNNAEKIDSKVFWWKFKSNNKSRKGENKTIHNGYEDSKGHVIKNMDEESCYYNNKIGEFERMIMKSRLMRAPITLEKGGGDVKSSLSKGKSWHFPSPIKVFRQRSKVVQERSPLQTY